jgi:hypothetical protein
LKTSNQPEMGNSDSQLDEKIAECNAIFDEVTLGNTTSELDKATIGYSERTGICYYCDRKASLHEDSGHAESCNARALGARPLWRRFTTTTCQTCKDPSIYECGGVGAFCEQHARDFIAGKISLKATPAKEAGDDDLWEISAPDARGMKYFSARDSNGISMGSIMFMGDLTLEAKIKLRVALETAHAAKLSSQTSTELAVE